MSTSAAASATNPDDSSAEPLIVEFPSGIPGFETCHRFVLVSSPELAPLACLRSLDPPEASFLTVDPRLLDPSYDLTLREFERARLGAGDEPLLWLALVTVIDGDASANLRAPIVINPQRMIGRQVLPDDGLYPVRHPLTTKA